MDDPTVILRVPLKWIQTHARLFRCVALWIGSGRTLSCSLPFMCKNQRNKCGGSHTQTGSAPLSTHTKLTHLIWSQSVRMWWSTSGKWFNSSKLKSSHLQYKTSCNIYFTGWLKLLNYIMHVNYLAYSNS